MIHCPYCGSPMNDSATSCPRCKSLMVEGTAKRKAFPALLHPLVALSVIVILSGGLLALSIGMGKKGTAVVKADESAQREEPGDAGGGSPAMNDSRERASAVNKEKPDQQDSVTSNADQYEQIVEYENKLTDIVGQANAIDAVLNGIVKANDKARMPEYTKKITEFQTLVQRVRGLAPPNLVRRSHTKVANAFAVRQRAYRNLMMYVESGEVKRLDRGRNDLETSQTLLEQAMAEIAAAKSRVSPTAAPVSETPVSEPEPSPDDMVQPTMPPPPPPPANNDREKRRAEREERIRKLRENRQDRPNHQRPGAVQPPPEDDVYPDDGEGPYLENGDSVYVDDGGSYYQDEDYPDDGGTYPQDDNYQDGGGEYYPEDQYPPPDGLPY